MIPHYAIVYNKPKVQVDDGLQQFDRFKVINYQHKISAFGGFDTAQFQLAIPIKQADGVFESYLGNEVRVFVDNPQVAIFEGYINRISIDTGVIAASVSLDSVYNRVAVSYSDDTGSERAKLTSEVVDTNSRAVYGTKMGVFEAGEKYSDGASYAEDLRDRKLEQHAFPQTTYAQSTGSPGITIQLNGFYHTWSWDAFKITGAPTSGPPRGYIRRLLADDLTPLFTGYNSSRFSGNGTGVFFRDDYDSGTDNLLLFTASDPGTTMDYNRELGRSHQETIQEIVELGGPSQVRNVAGITPTYGNGFRYGYYQTANTAVEYEVDAYSRGQIYNNTGGLVMPWEVRPNRSIRIQNLFTGLSEDYAVAYIDNITYDAEAQTVKWASDDDTSLQGVFQLGQSIKTTTSRFGATRRLSKG